MLNDELIWLYLINHNYKHCETTNMYIILWSIYLFYIYLVCYMYFVLLWISKQK